VQAPKAPNTLRGLKHRFPFPTIATIRFVLKCFQKLDGHDVEVWNDRVQDANTLEDEYEIPFCDIFDQITAFCLGKPINVNKSGIARHQKSRP